MEQEISQIICGIHSGPGQATHAHEADAELAWSVSCWGGQLAGDCSRCDAFDASRSNPHFKHKLCAACQQNGVSVPVDQVRAIEPSEHQTFTNSPGSGVWTERTHTDGSSILFRTVNHTRKCFGHWLVVFRSCPPQDIAWAPLAADLVHAGFVHLRLSKGTLVPERRAITQPPVGCMASRTSKRHRDQSSASPSPSLGSSVSSQADEGPAGAGGLSVQLAMPVPGVPRVYDAQMGGDEMGALLHLHGELEARIDGALGVASQTGGVASQTGGVASQLRGMPGLFGGGCAVSAAPMTLPLSDAQRSGLEALRASLRHSAALLRPVAGASEAAGAEVADRGPLAPGNRAPSSSEATSEPAATSRLCLSNPFSLDSSLTRLGLARLMPDGPGTHSNPPSPPATGTTRSSQSSTRSQTAAARWSSGLFSCLADPAGCMYTMLCWPVLAGQLGQKITRASRLCVCLSLLVSAANWTAQTPRHPLLRCLKPRCVPSCRAADVR